MKRRNLRRVEKVCFFKKSACSQSLSPLGHSVGFASCKAWCVLISASLPKTPFPGKGAILLGLPPLDQARMLAVSHTKPLHDAVAQMADDLYGGYAPKHGRFGCLPKVLHDAKPTKQATLDTPFLNNQEVYRQSRRNSPTFFIFPIDKSPVSVYTVYITHKQFDYLLCDVSLLI